MFFAYTHSKPNIRLSTTHPPISDFQLSNHRFLPPSPTLSLSPFLFLASTSLSEDTVMMVRSQLVFQGLDQTLSQIFNSMQTCTRKNVASLNFLFSLSLSHLEDCMCSSLGRLTFLIHKLNIHIHTHRTMTFECEKE